MATPKKFHCFYDNSLDIHSDTSVSEISFRYISNVTHDNLIYLSLNIKYFKIMVTSSKTPLTKKVL